MHSHVEKAPIGGDSSPFTPPMTFQVPYKSLRRSLAPLQTQCSYFDTTITSSLSQLEETMQKSLQIYKVIEDPWWSPHYSQAPSAEPRL